MLSNVIMGGVSLLAIAGLVSAGMLHSLFHCGRGFLRGSYATFVGLFGGIGFMSLLAGSPAGIFFLAIFAFGLVTLRRRKHSFAFGSANLKVCVLMCLRASVGVSVSAPGLFFHSSNRAYIVCFA